MGNFDRFWDFWEITYSFRTEQLSECGLVPIERDQFPVSNADMEIEIEFAIFFRTLSTEYSKKLKSVI